MKSIITFFPLLFVTFCISNLVYAQNQNSIQFNGTDEYALIGDENDLDSSDFTIEAWFYIESYTGNGNEVFSKGTTTAGTPNQAGYALRIGYFNPMEMDFSIHGDGGSFYTLNYQNVQTNQWYHVAIVRSGETIELYIDCELVDTNTIPSNLNCNTDIPFSIGALDKDGISFVDHYMDGFIDEVRIWDIARSKREICDWKDCSIDVPMPNLMAVYNMNHTSGNVVSDMSGNNHDGNLVNGGTWMSSTVATNSCYLDVDKNEVKEEALLLYPNPTSSIIQIQGINQKTTFNILDMSGKSIQKGTCYSNQIIDVSDLTEGVYIVDVVNNEIKRQLKFIKE